MIRVLAQKSELQGETFGKAELRTKGQSYNRGDTQNPNRITQKRAPNGVWVVLKKTPPEAFLNPPSVYVAFLL